MSALGLDSRLAGGLTVSPHLSLSICLFFQFFPIVLQHIWSYSVCFFHIYLLAWILCPPSPHRQTPSPLPVRAYGVCVQWLQWPSLNNSGGTLPSNAVKTVVSLTRLCNPRICSTIILSKHFWICECGRRRKFFFHSLYFHYLQGLFDSSAVHPLTNKIGNK